MKDITRRLHSALQIAVIEFLDFEDLKNLALASKVWYCICIREIHKRHSVISQQPSLFRYLGCFDQRKQVVVVSYPRGGSTLLRRLLEKLTGIWTGSDTIPTRTLGKQLLSMGMDGEGVSDSSVWLVKSHFPERHGEKRRSFQRVIVVVRNPFDCLDSYFNMIFTNTHNKTLTQESFDSLKHIWSKFLENEASIWNAFHKYWLTGFCNDAPTDNNENAEVSIVRYEDLINRDLFPRVMSDLHSFLYSDPFVCRREALLALDRLSTLELGNSVYEQRRGKRNKLNNFSQADLGVVRQFAREAMDYFGYSLELQETGENKLIVGAPQFAILGMEELSLLSQLPVVAKRVTINKSNVQIRSGNDLYGRNASILRKDLTNDDINSFPCI